MTDEEFDRLFAELDRHKQRRIQAREEKRQIRNHAQINAKGKLKIRSRTSGPLGRYLNHKRPRGNTFIKRGNQVTNPMAQFGYTDEEYKVYLKTGLTKAQQNQEGN